MNNCFVKKIKQLFNLFKQLFNFVPGSYLDTTRWK